MNPLEATVRLIENWGVLGKLSELNVGQTFELTKDLLDVFSASVKAPRGKRPSTKPEPKPEPKPVHVDMDTEDKWA